jgi:hypothetical protein
LRRAATTTHENQWAGIRGFFSVLSPSSQIPAKRYVGSLVRYHHLGIPTQEHLQDEIHLDHLKIYVSGCGENPYGIEWMRYEEDAPYPELVKTVAHVAFEVDDLDEAIRGKHVIIAPTSPSHGVLVAFIEENGAPIEFIQID